jgi:hypothetical protein
MENFDNFMFKKSIDHIAARCVREQLPIVEFVEWYEEEGQYQEGIMGNMAMGGLAGAGLGSWLGAPGAIAGGIGGAAYGLGKGIYDTFKDRSYNVTKQQAVNALMKFAKTSPSNAGLINKVANFIARINPEGAEGRPSNSQQRQQAQAQPQQAQPQQAQPQQGMDMSVLGNTPAAKRALARKQVAAGTYTGA